MEGSFSDGVCVRLLHVVSGKYGDLPRLHSFPVCDW